MSDVDDVLRGIYSADVIAEHKAARMVAYEERIIKKILARVGLDREAGKLAMRAKEKTGKARLTFEWFYDEYPNFPIYLGMRKVPFAFKVTVKELFNKFPSTPMFKAWEEFKSEAPVDDKAVGLIFDWPGVKGTQCVLHNWDKCVEWFDGNTRLIRSIGRGKDLQLVIIEQFEPFFARVLSVWIP